MVDADPGRAMSRTVRRELLGPVAAAASAGFVFAPAFGYRVLAAPVLVAATLPACAVALLRRVRPTWGSAAVLPVVLALALPAATALLFRNAWSAHGVWPAVCEAAAAASQVWSRLGVTVPASGRPDALAAPFLLTWAASASAVELRVRAGAAAMALLPPTGVLVVAVLLCAPQTVGGTLPAAVFAAAVGTDLAASQDSGTVFGQRPRWVVLPLAAGCATLALLAAIGWPWLDERMPYDFHRGAAVSRPGALDPLAQANAWASNPHETLFRTTGAAPSAWVLADLDDYDGTVWQPSGLFVSTASVAYLSSERPVASALTVATVRTEALTGPFLPHPAQAVSVARLPVSVSRHDSTVLAQHALRPGTSYRTTAFPRSAADASMDDTLVPDRSDEAALTVPDSVPSALTPLITRVTAALPPSATSLQRASALARWLTLHYAYLPAAAEDETLGGAERLLTTRQGSAASFVTVFALAAREMGLPARVAVGFSAGTRNRDGSRTVTGRDVKVWGEIRFVGVGWLRFDVLPHPSSRTDRAVDLPTAGAPRTTATPSAIPTPRPRTSLSALPSPPPPVAVGSGGGGGHASVPWLVVLTTAGSLCLAAAAWMVLASPRLRRRRARRRTTAAGRVIGAWEVSVHRLARYRFLGRASLGTFEDVRAALQPRAQQALRTPLEALGVLALQARYGEPDAEEARAHPDWPRLTDADADRAWQLEAEIAERCRRVIRAPRPMRVRRQLRAGVGIAAGARDTEHTPSGRTHR
ncbi:transglutaminaseTgpA domain-containing protein [Streptomyces sp. NPDC054783]